MSLFLPESRSFNENTVNRHLNGTLAMRPRPTIFAASRLCVKNQLPVSDAAASCFSCSSWCFFSPAQLPVFDASVLRHF
jgi:hypothetical protein